MTKEEHIRKVMELLAQAANIESEAEKLGYEYTLKYCPYKIGDRLRVKPHYGSEVDVVVRMLHFDSHSTIEGLASITCRPFTNGFKKEMTHRNNFFIKSKEEIIKHYNSLTSK